MLDTWILILIKMEIRRVVEVHFGKTGTDGFTEILDKDGNSYGFINLNTNYGNKGLSE